MKTDLVPNVPLEKIANTNPLQLGYINRTEVSDLFKTVQQAYKIDTTKIDPTSLYTNQFVQPPPSALSVHFEALAITSEMLCESANVKNAQYMAASVS